MLRTFIAIPLPAELRAALGALAQDLAPHWPGVRWVRSENIHLTLRFLGGTDPAHLPALTAGLDALAQAHAPFSARLGEVGGFPNLRRPRVLWVGVAEDNERLAPLQKGVERLVRSLGWERDAQLFKPHLTIGRIKEAGPVPTGEWRIAPLTFAVDTVELIESRLKPAGPEYAVLHRAVLGVPA